MSKPRGVKKSRTVRQPSIQPRAISPWAIPLALAVITLAVFYPALNGKFLNWDDQANLLDSPYYRGLGWTHLRWMFTTFHMGHYQPLSWVTLGVDYLLWGMNPFGYHLTNLILHAGNAMLLYFVALRLLSLAWAIPNRQAHGPALQAAAAFAALLFAIHPMRVESVAWVTERRDVLSGFFFLATVLLYLQAAGTVQPNSRQRWLLLSLAAYVFSVLAKAVGMTLPLVLLALDFYPLRRLGGKEKSWIGKETSGIWWEKIPFFAIAIVIGAIALRAQQESGSLISLEDHGIAARVAQAFYGLAFYVWKTVLPLGLAPLYKLPRNIDPWDRSFLLSGIFVTAVSVALVIWRRRWLGAFTAWACYGLLLSPVLGVAQSGPQLVADRYSYLPCLGWAILCGAALYYCWRNAGLNGAKSRVAMVAAGAAVLITSALGFLAWKQSRVWHDSETLWRYALRVDSDSAVAYNNLGTALMDQHRVDEAMEQFKTSMRVDPREEEAYYNLARALEQKQEPEAAINNYRMAVRVKPDYLRAIYALAVDLAKKGEFDEAIAQLQQALKLKNGRSRTYFNLANIFVVQRRGQDAIHYLRLALQEQPDFAEADDQLGNLLAAQGNLTEALQHLHRAVELDSEWSEAHFDLANTLARQGNLVEAVEHFEKALQSRPDYVEAHNNLGRVLAAQGDLTGAMEHFRQALRLRPDYIPARESLAMALAEQGKRDEAVLYHQ